MTTISVWNIDLGDAVMGVPRQRDGFRNSSDERSNGAVAIRHSYWQRMPQRGANNLRNRSLAAVIFSVQVQNTWRFSAMSLSLVRTSGVSPRLPWVPGLARWMACSGYGWDEISSILRKSPNIPSPPRRRMPQQW